MTSDGGVGSSNGWAFVPQLNEGNERGWRMNDQELRNSAEDFAWTIWVRRQ